LDGSSALVTGSTVGIGVAIAQTPALHRGHLLSCACGAVNWTVDYATL